MGLWDRVSGRRGKVSRKNEKEITDNRQRDRGEHQEVISRQLTERQELQKRIKKLNTAHDKETKKLVKELGHSVQIVDKALTNAFNDAEQGKEKGRKKDKMRDDFGDSSRQEEKEKMSDSFNEKADSDREDKKEGKPDKDLGRTRKRDPH